MAVYICVELQSINSLPEIMNCLLERSIKFTVSKDRRSLCDRCSVKEETSLSPGCSYLPQLPLVSTPSSASLDAYPRSESVDSEPSDNAKEEVPTPAQASEFTQVQVKEEPYDNTRNYGSNNTPSHPLKKDSEELDLVACGSELLQQVSANFTCYKDKAEMTLAEIEAALNREKGTASAPKQCQLCGHWITAKNVRAHVATHLTIRRLRCTLCGQGFDRMNRASVHIDKCHSGDPLAKVESAMNAEQRKEIEMLARKCFPRKVRCSSADETTVAPRTTT